MKCYNELDKFPVCFDDECLMHLEIQNRFKCVKCLNIFCAEHRLQFNHKCVAIIDQNKLDILRK